MTTVDGDQLALVVRGVRKRTSAARRRVREPAAAMPIARVAVDVPLAHLDRPFDYLVPAALDAGAVPGCRVRVRFAGQLLDGFLLERADSSEHEGRLGFLERVVSPEPVLTAEIAALARAVADRWAGTLADVLRLAVPPRHARVEAAASVVTEAVAPAFDSASWSDVAHGPALLDALKSGKAPRVVWNPPPSADWPGAIAAATAATLASGRGVVVVVPDARDLERVDAALAGALGLGNHVSLAADLGPAERYRRWLAVRRGAVRVVAGTRAAMFAPVADLGLVVVWDDGDDLLAEPRAPYPHARDVLLLRTHLAGAGAIVGGFARTAEAARLVSTGWARDVRPSRVALRGAAPRVVAVSDAEPAERGARLPSVALRALREALRDAPVLVQVPRRGYAPTLACATCRAPARCSTCGGPLASPGRDRLADCRWCGRPAGGWRCGECDGRRLRAVVVGAGRTAEELGRAFPGVPVRTSAGDGVLERVPGEPAIVVATPGAEPVADGGYGAALLLDTWSLLGRPEMRAGGETLRRWVNAASLVRSSEAGGRVVVMAEPSLPVVQALVRWDVAGFAERELAERAALGFPPSGHVAEVSGDAPAVAAFLGDVTLPPSAVVLGPVPVEGDGDRVRALVRAPIEGRADLTSALRAAQALRSARKAPGSLRVRVDPADLA